MVSEVRPSPPNSRRAWVALAGLAVLALGLACRRSPASERPLAKLAHVSTTCGEIYADTREAAARIAKEVEAAAARFEQVFGPCPHAGVVIITASDANAKIQQAFADGAEWVLPWMDLKPILDDPGPNGAYQKVLRQAELQILELLRNDEGLRGKVDPDSYQEIVQRQAPELAADALGTVRRSLRDSAVAHELGHVWFIKTFWPNAFRSHNPVVRIPHYGGPAADWLDEVAAILLEPNAITQVRRSAARTAFAKGAQPACFLPLREFFSSPHPSRSGSSSEKNFLVTLFDNGLAKFGVIRRLRRTSSRSQRR